MPDPTPAADRNLLFGIVALQMDFVGRDALVAAMHAWVLEKSKPLGQILEDHKALTRSRRTILEALVAEHVRQHGGDPARSLAALSSGDAARSAFEVVDDSEVRASLVLVAADRGKAASPSTRHPIGEVPTPTDLDVTPTYESPVQRYPARFRILRPHAKGGLGVVSVALDGELNRHVALKEFQDHHADLPESRARFVVEAEITGGLEHPGIVPVYSLGHDPSGRPFYAMRFIEGDSLHDAIKRFHADESLKSDPGARTLALQKLLRRFLDVCEAIAYAHSRGVLHRDLKPGNIMVGRFGETLVVDWGLAKVVGTPEGSGEATLRPSGGKSGSGATLPGSAVGTPAYMSPEQAEGRLDDLGPASDVYSLGATLHALLTGKAPLDGPDVAAVLEKVRRGEVPPPRQVNPDVPPPLDAICRKAMALKPGDRYATPLGLSEDIEAWLADEVVSAYPEPLAVRARRWVRRHQKLVAGASTAALVVLVSLAGLAAVISVANRNLKVANDKISDQVIQIGRQNAELDRTNQNLIAANTTIRGQNDRLEAINAELETANTTIQGQNAELERTNQNLLAANATIRDQNTRLEAINAELAAANTTIQDQNIDLEQTNQELATANGTIKGQNAELEATNASLEVAKAEADRERDQAEAVTEFLVTSFRKSDPEQSGREVTIAEVLGRAVEELDAEQAMNPLTRAEILNAIGQTYGGLGLVTEAVGVTEAALAIRLRELGGDHPDTLTSQNNLALAYHSDGRLDEAIPIYEQTLEATRAKLGGDHPDTLTSQNNLAAAYRAAGRLDEAIPIYEQTLEAMRAKLGGDHPDTLRSQNNLALAYQSVGRLDEAIPIYEQTLEAMRAKLGGDHPDTLTSQNNLALAYKSAGRLDVAIPIYQRTLEATRAKLGGEHPDTLRSQNNLAAAYESAGRLDEAIPIYEQTLEARRAKLGGDHPDTLRSQNNLALAYHSDGRLDEAIPIYQRTLEATRAKLGGDHPDTLRSQNNLALAYKSAGRLAEAIPLYQRTLEARRAKLGGEHPDTLTSQNNLAGAYYAAGRLAEAIPLYQRTLEAMRVKLGGDHPATLTSQNNLAGAYYAAGRLAEAIPLYQRTLEAMRVKLGVKHPNALIIEGNLLRAYLAAGEHDGAERILRARIERVGGRDPGDQAERARLLAMLGKSLIAQSKYDEALMPLREGLEIHERTQPGQWSPANTRSLLGEALAGLGEFAEAEALLIASERDLRARADGIPPEGRAMVLDNAVARLARLDDAWGQPSEAARWRAKLPAEAAMATLPTLRAHSFAWPGRDSGTNFRARRSLRRIGARPVESSERRSRPSRRPQSPGARIMASATTRTEPRSAATSPPIPPLENGERLSRTEFERRYNAMPELKKAELIEGVVSMGSPVGARRHGGPHADVIGWLSVYRAATPGVLVFDNSSVRLDLDNMPQPDVSLLIDPARGGQARISEDDYVEGAPELVVEVAASSVSYDLNAKLDTYRRHGVREYLTWRVRDRAIDWRVLRGTSYEMLVNAEGGIHRSGVFPGLWLDPEAMLRGDLATVLEVLRAGLTSPEHAAFVERLRG